MRPKGTACPSNRGIAVGQKFEPACAPPACNICSESCPHPAFGRCCACAWSGEGNGGGAGDEGRAGWDVGWREGDSEGTRRGTRRGLAGDFRGTRAPFGGLAQKSGAFSSGFRGTRPRPRRAFIILKGDSEVFGGGMRSVSELHGWPPSKILWAAGQSFLEATVCCLHVLVGALSRLAAAVH